MHNTLTPEEVSLFRALIKSGVILLLMLRLARPTGAREIADILGLDEHTVAKHLRSLRRLNLVTRTGRYSGYILMGGSPKRQALASRPDITPEAIRAWEANLKHEKGRRYTPGLLIHMLESGEPTPPVNQMGHHLNCEQEQGIFLDNKN